MIDQIRIIIFQDHFPEIKHAKRYILPGASREIQVCLTSDKKSIYIGAPGGVNACYVCERMFKGLHLVENIVFEHNSFHTDNAGSFSGMFQECRSLRTVNVREFKTGKATSFERMFSGCERLTDLNLSGFDTSSAYKFTRMFNGCKSLKELDLTSFRTVDVNNFSCLFENCRNLEKVRILSKSFVIREDAITDKMFAGCAKLNVENSRLMKGRPKESYM